MVEVGLDGVVGEAEALAELGGVEDAALLGCNHAEEPVGQRGLRREAPSRQVPLSHQGQIVRLPLGKSLVTQNPAIGVSAALPEQVGSGLRQLGKMKWRQLCQRHASGQRLAHLAHERGRNRAEEQEAPVLLAPGVNGRAQTGEHLRPRLRFVQHHQVVALGQIVPSEVQPKTLGRLFQVVVLRGKAFRQRGLATLARPDQGHRRELRQAFLNQTGNHAFDHVCKIEIYFCFARSSSRPGGGVGGMLAASRRHHAPMCGCEQPRR